MPEDSSVRKMLVIIIEDVDRWGDQPLHEAILRILLKAGVSGATAWTGMGGYGAGGRLHHRGLFGVSDEKPILIAAVDTEAKLRTVAPSIIPMMKGGVVFLQDVEVLSGDCGTERP
jgi:PII-like signaling protein